MEKLPRKLTVASSIQKSDTRVGLKVVKLPRKNMATRPLKSIRNMEELKRSNLQWSGYFYKI